MPAGRFHGLEAGRFLESAPEVKDGISRNSDYEVFENNDSSGVCAIAVELSCVCGIEFLVVCQIISDGPVALARTLFESGAVKNANHAPLVVNQPFTLQSCRNHRDRGPRAAEHVRQKLL